MQYVAENALFLHLDFFPLNCGDLSDEHGERFYQDISVMEHRYKGKWSAAMLGGYCWMMKLDAPETKYHRQAKRTRRYCQFLFLFIVHITLIMLLSRKQELTNEF